MRFNNLNLGKEREPKFTEKDVVSEKLPEVQEKIDYAGSNDGMDLVIDLGKKVNSMETMNSAFNFKFIARERLQFNPNNDFDMNEQEIEELAESMIMIGMQHNLGAFYDSERDCYILESGERRLRACDLLKERFDSMEETYDPTFYAQYISNIKPFFESGFPVNVKKAKHENDDEDHQKLDHIDSELRKYKSNIDVRTIAPQERVEYIRKVRHLIDERNKILYGSDAPVPTQEEIASAVGTSARQLRKYDAIDNLIPALREEFKNGNISINKVPGIAALPEDEQMIFLNLLQKGKHIDTEQIKLYKQHMEQAEQARQQAETEKEKIELELERIRESKDSEIAAILDESKKREEIIRDQIEKAVQEKNEDAIIKLQNDLAREKESSSRLIVEANRALENTKEALDSANQKLAKYQQERYSNANDLQLKAEISVNIALMTQTAEKLMELFHTYGDGKETEENAPLTREEIGLVEEWITVFKK